MNENETEIAEVARTILETLLDLMGVPASVNTVHGAMVESEVEEPSAITLNVEGDDLGILIGRRGQTLSCLQYLVRIIIGHQEKVWVPIVIDVEGYKQRRCNALQSLAWRIAEQVTQKREPFALEPMPAFDRRIIHLTLADHPEVTTESNGEGEARRVVVVPKGLPSD
ncbi:MAG TPA: R3H domain-containing nucleic acid-binding protein [Dehalococcoidales bacterium]|nr:R3H domain-containing nucleic acid-binding protein [Dehalococcoidales bacterium]